MMGSVVTLIYQFSKCNSLYLSHNRCQIRWHPSIFIILSGLKPLAQASAKNGAID
jgi:hypothetical protein